MIRQVPIGAENMPLTPLSGLTKIRPYQPGQVPMGGGGPGIKLSANESAIGPSPMAIKAYQKGAEVIERYPDGNAIAVRKAIAEYYGLRAEKVLMGVGSDELLSVLVRAYAGQGDEVVYPTATFSMYRIYTHSAGADIVQARDAGYTADVDALLDAVTERTKVMIVANPNNPTGTYLNHSEMQRLRANLRDDILLIIDAAYAEYVTKQDYDSGFALVDATDNTAMTRTFSKVHGLASMRLGWCYTHVNIVSVIGRMRSPFNVSMPAQMAGVAALGDKSHVIKVVSHTAKWHGIATQRLAALGLEITGTEGNFVCAGFPHENGKRAEDCFKYLRDQNIIVRQLGMFGLPNHLRITIGLDEEISKCLDAVEAFFT